MLEDGVVSMGGGGKRDGQTKGKAGVSVQREVQKERLRRKGLAHKTLAAVEKVGKRCHLGRSYGWRPQTVRYVFQSEYVRGNWKGVVL